MVPSPPVRKLVPLKFVSGSVICPGIADSLSNAACELEALAALFN